MIQLRPLFIQSRFACFSKIVELGGAVVSTQVQQTDLGEFRIPIGKRESSLLVTLLDETKF